jgi:hypothetical protein
LVIGKIFPKAPKQKSLKGNEHFYVCRILFNGKGDEKVCDLIIEQFKRS